MINYTVPWLEFIRPRGPTGPFNQIKLNQIAHTHRNQFPKYAWYLKSIIMNVKESGKINEWIRPLDLILTNIECALPPPPTHTHT